MLTATAIWGMSFSLIKQAANEIGVGPFLVYRFGIAIIVLTLFFPNKVFKASRKTMTKGLVLGLLLAGAIQTQAWGLTLTTASRSSFLTALYVPFTPLMGWLLLRRYVTWRQALVALVSFVGLYLLTTKEIVGLGEWFRTVNLGDLITVGTAFLNAVHILMTEPFSKSESDSIALGIWQFVGCVAVFLFGTLIFPGVSDVWNPSSWSNTVVLSVAFNAVLTTAFAFIVQIISQKYMGSLKAALIFALEAPFAAVFAYFYLHERLTSRETLGALIVLATSLVPEGWLKKRIKNGSL